MYAQALAADTWIANDYELLLECRRLPSGAALIGETAGSMGDDRSLQVIADLITSPE